MPLIPFEEGLGLPPSGESKAAAPVAGKKLIPFEEGLGLPYPKQDPSIMGALTDKSFWKDVGGRIVGTGMQLSDMTTGAVKQVLGAAPYWAANASALATTGDKKIAASVANMAKDELLPAALFTPWSVVAESLGPEAQHAYENNPVAWVMGKIGEVAQYGADKVAGGTGVPAEHVMQLVDQTMGSMMLKGMTPKVKSALEARIDQFKNRGAAEVPPQPAPESPGPAPVEPKGGPLDVIDTKAKVKAIFDKAKQGEGLNVPDAAAVNEMFNRVRRGEDIPREPMDRGGYGTPPPKPEAPPLDPNRIGAQVGEVPKTRLTDPTIIGEEAPKPYSAPDIERALTKVQNGQGFDLTAEERIALTKLKQDAKGRFVDQYGKPLAIAAATAAALSQLDDLSDEQKVMGVLGATMVPKEARAWGKVSESLHPYTFPSLDNIGKGTTEISKAQIEQRLKDPKIPEAERAIVQRVLAAQPGEKIYAADLAAGLHEETSGLTLTPKVTEQYADYGLANIDRGEQYGTRVPQKLPPANTTLYKLPEGSPVDSTANHFSEPDLFGWTRSFREDGQRHVVELQSDLAQHAKGALPPEEYAARLKGAEAMLVQLSAMREHNLADNFSADTVKKLVEKGDAVNPDFSFQLRAFLEEQGEADALPTKVSENLPDAQWLVERAKEVDAAPRVNDVFNFDAGKVRNAFRRAFSNTATRLNRLLDESNVALNATAVSSQLSPIMKNWPRRLIREELLDETRHVDKMQAKIAQLEKLRDAPTEESWRPNELREHREVYQKHIDQLKAEIASKTVRFADADTVAKVEGWPEKGLESRDSLGRITMRETPGKFEDPGHQSIYDRYAGEITRYLKGLGGKHVVDKEGHGWYEVPLKAIETPRGPMIKMLGNSDPKTLAGVAAAASVGIAAAGGMLPGIEKGAPRITPFVGPKPAAPTTLQAAGLANELAYKMTPEVERATIAQFRDNPPGSRARDQAATALYNENHRQVARAINSYAKAGIDLEEIVQHAFVKAFRTLEQSPEEGGFRGDSKFSTYLHTIATNLAKNAYKRGNPLKLEELTEEHADSVADPQARTPLQELQNKALAARMQRAIDRLPDEFRDTFVMKELEGLSNQEIAAKLGVPEGTIASRLSRATQRLQRDLREFSDGESGKVDPRVVAGIAALGGGAVLGSYLQPDNPLTGAGYGIAVGALLMGAKPIEWTKGLVKALEYKGPRVDISQMVGDVAYGVKVQKRVNLQNRERWSKAVPDPQRQEAIYQYLEGEIPTKLTPVEQAVAQEVRANFNLLGEAAKKAGVVKQLLEDYATRIYDRPAQGMFETKQVGGTSTTSPFAKPRGYKTRAEAEAAGWKVKTTNIIDVMDAYSESMTRAIQAKQLLSTLEAASLPDGTKLITDGKHVPKGYVFSRLPQLKGKFVHPDIMPDLEFLFQTRNVGAMLGALDAINSTQKRMAVSASLFHAMALEHAMVGATSMLKSPLIAVKSLGQSFLPGIFGESLAIKMIKEGGAGDLIDRGMKAGLEHSLDPLGKSASMEDASGGMYRGLDAMTKYLDSAVPQLGTQTTGRFVQLNHLFDKAMWGRFHTTLKLMTFADKASELSRNNAREVAAGRGELKSRLEIDKMAASFTNDIYGGLNWYQLGNEFQSRWGRQLAMAAVSPHGRLAMRLALFAPDWTISTTRAFTKAFGTQGLAVATAGVLGSQLDTESPYSKLVGGGIGAALGLGAAVGLGLKGAKGSGIRGALPEELGGRAQNLTDLHRQYFMRSAFLYTAIVDATNYQLTGHHIWDNKDPTRLDLGDGRTMQVSKHFMEPFHWLIDPKKQAMGKASFVVKETGSQLMDQEYLSPHGAPRMGGTPRGQDVSLPTRITHAAKQFTPISAQGFEASNPQSAIASLAGMPIYGKTYEEQAAAKQKRKLDAIQRRIDKRARGEGK